MTNSTDLAVNGLEVLDAVDRLVKSGYHPTREEAFKAVEIAVKTEALETGQN